MVPDDYVDPDSHVESDSATPSETGLDIEDRVLRELQPDTSRDEAALELLRDLALLDRFLDLGSSVGIVGEEENRQAVYVIMTARKVSNYRLHARFYEQSGSGKTELTRFVLSTMPQSEVLSLGGGVSKRGLQYAGDMSGKIVFIDEADHLDDDTWAILREAMTKSQVDRLVTVSDGSGGYAARMYSLRSERLVIIQAGSRPLADPANETRIFRLHPDASPEQKQAILDVQALRAEQYSPQPTTNLSLWIRAQELLRVCHVAIPYATSLRGLFNSSNIRARRDFPRLLALIAATACLHQFQRDARTLGDDLVVEADVRDYDLVYRFAGPIFATSAERLRPTQREVLSEIRARKRMGAKFRTNDVAGWMGRAYTTVRDHLLNLESLGILESAQDKNGKFWCMVALNPRGIGLPSPEALREILSTDGADAEGGGHDSQDLIQDDDALVV